MNLTPITEDQFPLWKGYRNLVYGGLSTDFHDKEMEIIYKSADWFCYFLTDINNVIIGMVELSSRNIVDGCLSSPVAYIEGIYIDPKFRGKGNGKKVIDTIHSWCKEHNYTELAADAELTNENAQRFFNAVGFQETYRVVEYATKVK